MSQAGNKFWATIQWLRGDGAIYESKEKKNLQDTLPSGIQKERRRWPVKGICDFHTKRGRRKHRFKARLPVTRRAVYWGWI